MNLAMPSLERRIRRGLILLVVPAFILLLFVLHNVMQRITSEYIGSRLGDDVENIITALEWTDERWSIDESRVSGIYKRVRTGHYYVISWDGGELRSRSLWDAKPEVQPLPPGEIVQFRVSGIGDERWLVWQQGVRKQGHDMTIWVAEDISLFIARQNEYEYYLLTILVALTLFILLLQRRILQWGFGTLKPLQNALLRGKVSGAVNFPEDIPQEVKPLAEAIERLVDHSGKQLSRSRMATGNLAHELKLPLQHLQMLAEAAEPSDNRESLRQIYSQLHRRIESELRRARISGSPAPGELFNPREELPYLVQLLNQKRSGGEIELNQQVPETAIPFDRDDMLELVGNLLDNAWRYARSRVLLSIRENRGNWTIIVSDDGPGIPVEKISSMTWRGNRADEQGDNNHGLGLSICNSVVISYNGKMSLNAGRLGGLQVIIDLPQSASDDFEEGSNNET